MVLAAGPELIEDIRRAPEDVLSMREPIIEVGIMSDTLTTVILTRVVVLSSSNQNIRWTC